MPHATSSVAWFVDLVEVAPSVDRTLLRIVARLLAGGVGVEELLLVGSALDDAIAELTLSRHDRVAAEMRALRALLDVRIDEVSAQAGTFW